MDKVLVSGVAKQVKGSVKAVGQLMGDSKTQSDGSDEKTVGNV
jgi:uncharacterized protein YjbJ (UPF0337 family)